MGKDFKTGDEIGKVLASTGIKTVVLNACSSASFQCSTPESNLAEVLISHGVESVLAMAYKVVDEAVEILVNTFYQSLIVSGVSARDAARMSRLALIKNRSRRARYMHNVELADYVVPVFYTCRADSNQLPSQQTGTLFSYLEKVLSTVTAIPQAMQGTDIMIPMGQDLVGRDPDILSLESLLSIVRVILLHGQGGCGKSELLRYVCRWWKASGWIEGCAWVDFSAYEEAIFSLEDIVDSIGTQLGIPEGRRSESEVIEKLHSTRYVLLFDSIDALDSPILTDHATTDPELPRQLKSFIDRATSIRGGSMAILCSRLAMTPIASNMSDGHKYHLIGVSVLESVHLLQRLACESGTKLADTFYRRENIEFLRRVAILLEDNPTAIRMIVPTLKQVNYDGEALFNKLLYGACQFNDKEWATCRFYRSIVSCIHLPSFIDPSEPIHLNHFTPFWTLMPKDLAYYYYYLSGENFPKTVRPEDLPKFLETQPETRLLRKRWLSCESKMLRAGILGKADITKEDGKTMACYHIHPMFTLIARSGLEGDMLRRLHVPFIRQTIHWADESSFVSVKWDGTTQHEDYIHNIRAMALAWSLDSDDLQEEIQTLGVSLFFHAYVMCIPSLHTHARQERIFIPLFKEHLLRMHMLVTFFRENGVPAFNDLSEICICSLNLNRLEEDTKFKSSIVRSALEMADTYKASKPEGAGLNSSQEFSWFQLRHAEAENWQLEFGNIDREKELYERNLADDPSTTDEKMLNAIRRVQYNNLERWALCVSRIAVQEGSFDEHEGEIASLMRHLSSEIKTLGIFSYFNNVTAGKETAIETLLVRDIFSFAVQHESAAVSKFGILAKNILDAPLVNVFADVGQKQGLNPGALFTDLLRKICDSSDPLGAEIRVMFAPFEAMIHQLGGDSDGSAAAAIGPSIQRDALDSTSATKWENLASNHMMLYAIAVESGGAPDYKKGLLHLTHWWEQHQGIGISKMNLCHGHDKFAVCYNGLDRVVDAAREVIKIVQIIPTMTRADLPPEEGHTVEGFDDWQHRQFVRFDKLDMFLDQNTFLSCPASVAGLSLKERFQMHIIMKKAHELERLNEISNQDMDRSVEYYKKIKDMAREWKLPLSPDVAKKLDDHIQNHSRSQRKPTDFISAFN
jgi:hypothetical protein